MTRIDEIKKIEIFPIIGDESHLNVKGLKDEDGRNRTGFFITGMRFINVEQPEPRRIRARITWNAENQAVEIEENVSSVMKRGIALSVFFLKIKEGEEGFEFQDPVTVRGNPEFTDQTFEGTSINCAWSSNPLMLELSSTEGRFLSAKLRTKQQIIEVRIG
ncbi:MAG: hypothetical protein ACW97Z_13930 [Candidatus Hodarchaeales archaeon]|jgi:hypothetical protein